VFGEPSVKLVERGAFGDTGGAIKIQGCMVGDEDVAGFAIETSVSVY
jgi:hypothetical protein